MANTSYLDLTNKLLQDFNEPVLTSGTFSTARGVHRVAKNAINTAVDLIQTKEYTWPFNHQSGSQLLVVNQVLYDMPADMKHIDMNSFYMEKDDALGSPHRELTQISEQEYNKRYRRFDLSSTTEGLRQPEYVFRAQGNKWGVTPVVNQAYTVHFDYWTNWTRMSASTDVSTIPTEWDHVIYAIASIPMWKHYNNDSMVQEAKDMSKGVLANMRQLLVPKDPKVYTGQLLVGGYYAQ